MKLAGTLLERIAWPGVRYAAAAGLAATATLLRVAAEGVLENRLVGWTFFPAIIVAGLALGLGPALVTVALCTAAVWLLAIHPAGLSAGAPRELSTLALFVAVGCLLAVIAAAYRRAVARLRLALGSAQAAADRLTEEQERAAHATEALRESEERFRMLAEAVPGVIYTARPDGARDYISPAFYEYTGLPEGAAEGWGWVEAVHPADRDRLLEAWHRAMRTGTPFRNEHRFRSAAGSYRWFMSRAIPERDADGRIIHWFGTATDVHELHETREELTRHRDHLEDLIRERTAALETSQEHLRLSERLAALGTLAAGLGHDLGNLLLPIRARLDVLRMRDLPPDAEHDVDAIEQCAEYLQSLARGLRLFARDPRTGGGPDTATDLESWRRDVAPFLRNILTRNITLEWDLPPGLPAAQIAPHQLTQAVVNLINNAKDAVGADRPGRIVVRAEAVLDIAPPAVRISVIDDGPGMSDEIRRHALEPFFTTKVRGVATGTGLGLALVHGAIEAAGGSISILTGPQRGTAVMLTLLAADPVGSEPEGPSAAAAITVDDPRVRALVSSILRSMGFEIQWETPERGDAAELWVTTPSPRRLEAARRQGGRRRIIVLGGGDEPEWRRLGAVQLREYPSPTDIRGAIEDALTGGVDAAWHRHR